MFVNRIKRKYSSNKGVVNLIELILVLVLLFASFAIFFPGVSYRNKWEDAYGVITTRDAILVLEHTGMLHEYAFDDSKMNTFLDKLFPDTNLILWTDVTGGIKGEIRIATDAPNDVISELNTWVDGFMLNEREIKIIFCYTEITSTDYCLLNSDALLIWGYKSLNDKKLVLDNYLSGGNGIVEVMDFDEEEKIEGDIVQTDIFGLRFVGISKSQADYVEFSRDPEDNSDIIYEPHKYFYSLPLPIGAYSNGGTVEGCTYNPTKTDTLSLKGVDYNLWTCSEDSVCLDVDEDGVCIEQVNELSQFSLGGNQLYLNYVTHDDSKISVSFRPDHIFNDFLAFIQPGGLGDEPLGDPGGIWRIQHLEPIDGDQNRILLRAISSDPYSEYPAVILNNVDGTNVAWMAYFGEDDGGYSQDEKQMMMSLLFWAANKESSGVDYSDIRYGYKTSRVNVENRDMFEIYKFDFGVGYPV